MRLMAYCINALFVIVVTATSTFAAEAVSIIGVYQSAGAGMGVAIYNDPKDKVAAFAVDVLQLNQPKVRLNVGFGTEEWQQFAQIWLKARRTAPPRRGFSTEIGSYFDRLGKTSITVSVEKDGSITFAIVGKPKDKIVAGLIEIEPKDFERFDETVKKLTDYFKD